MKRIVSILSAYVIILMCNPPTLALGQTDKESTEVHNSKRSMDTLRISSLRADADLYLKYSYSEAKQLGLQFLTLVSAVLVFSLSFAEKIFGFPSSSKGKKKIMIAAWSLFLLAII